MKNKIRMKLCGRVATEDRMEPNSVKNVENGFEREESGGR